MSVSNLLKSRALVVLKNIEKWRFQKYKPVFLKFPFKPISLCMKNYKMAQKLLGYPSFLVHLHEVHRAVVVISVVCVPVRVTF